MHLQYLWEQSSLVQSPGSIRSTWSGLYLKLVDTAHHEFDGVRLCFMQEGRAHSRDSHCAEASSYFYVVMLTCQQLASFEGKIHSISNLTLS